MQFFSLTSLSYISVDTSGGKLNTKMLETKNVYILDCHSEIFVW